MGCDTYPGGCAQGVTSGTGEKPQTPQSSSFWFPGRTPGRVAVCFPGHTPGLVAVCLPGCTPGCVVVFRTVLSHDVP